MSNSRLIDSLCLGVIGIAVVFFSTIPIIAYTWTGIENYNPLFWFLIDLSGFPITFLIVYYALRNEKYSITIAGVGE